MSTASQILEKLLGIQERLEAAASHDPQKYAEIREEQLRALKGYLFSSNKHTPLHNVDILGFPIDANGPEAKELLAPHKLFIHYLSIIKSFEDKVRFPLYGMLRSYYRRAEDRYRKEPEKYYEQFKGMKTPGRTNGQPYYRDANDDLHLPTPEWANAERAARFCNERLGTLFRHMREDLIAREPLKERTKVAHAMRKVLGSDFAEEVLENDKERHELLGDPDEMGVINIASAFPRRKDRTVKLRDMRRELVARSRRQLLLENII